MLCSKAIMAAVVRPLELGDLRPARLGADQPGGVQRRLGAGVGEPHLVDGGEATNEFFRNLRLEIGGIAETESALDLSLHRRRHVGMRVAEDHRRVVRAEVDDDIAVDVGEAAPIGVIDVEREGRARIRPLDDPRGHRGPASFPLGKGLRVPGGVLFVQRFKRSDHLFSSVFRRCSLAECVSSQGRFANRPYRHFHDWWCRST